MILQPEHLAKIKNFILCDFLNFEQAIYFLKIFLRKIKENIDLFLLLFAIAFSDSFVLNNFKNIVKIELRLEDFILLVLLFLWLAKFIKNREEEILKIKETPFFGVISLWLLAGVLSIVFNLFVGNYNFIKGIFYFLKEVEFFFIYFYVYWRVKEINSAKFLINLWILFIAINLIFIFFQFFSGIHLGEYCLRAIAERGVFPSGAFFLLPFIFLFNVLFYYILNLDISAVKKIFFGIVILSIIFGVFGSGSKTSAAALFFSFFLTLFFFIFKAKNWKLFLIFLFVIFAAVILFFSFSNALLCSERINIALYPDALADSYLKARWYSAIKDQLVKILTQPVYSIVFGLGKGYGETHNQYLRNLADAGLIGFIIFFVLIFSILKAAYFGFLKSKNSFLTGLFGGFLISTLAMLFMGLATEPFLVVKPAEIYWFFAGITMAVLAIEKKQNLPQVYDKPAYKPKKKEDIPTLFLLLIILILPRIAAYPLFGSGIVGTDAEFRYFPQVEELSKSFANFFSQTGPFYTLFLLILGKLTGSLVAIPVFLQHILGIISAFLVFHYFKKTNMPLAFAVTVFSFSIPMAIWLEHTILREALVSFFLILLVLILSLLLKDNKYLKFPFGLLAGLFAVILFLLRIELIILLVLMPFIFFLIKKRNFPALKFNDRSFLKWLLGYFFLFFVFFLVRGALPEKPKEITSYGSFFSIAYYNLQPDTFYYQNSKYPELLQGYQRVLGTTNKTAGKSMNMLYKETENYLAEHPEVKLSMPEIMNQIYIEIMTKNTLVYLKSFVINLKNQLLGIAELNSSVTKSEYRTITGVYLIDQMLLFFNILMIILSKILFWLFLLALPLFFIKWKFLPDKVIMSFLIGAIHIFVLAFFADPAHRFRYAQDPFIYFAQFYLILIFFQLLISKIRSYNIKR